MSTPATAPESTGSTQEGLPQDLDAILAALRSGAVVKGPLDLSGRRLIGADLTGLVLDGAGLSGADLSGLDLSGARLMRANLSGATLHGTKLAGAELTGAQLEGAHLQEADLRGAGLGHASLAGADLSLADLGGATLIEADLEGADLRMCNLEQARLTKAVLEGADLTKARLAGAQLEGARIAGATFDRCDLRGASLVGLDGFRDASWIAVDLREIDFTGAYLCRNEIMDQNFLAEFRAQSRWSEVVYQLWRVTSDCGRSIARWAVCTVALMLMFGGIFRLVDLDLGGHATWLSYIYFSVVTFTTLGYGDVLPASATAQFTVMVEVTCGYVMLGGLLSIFSNKMASRAHGS